MSSTKIDEIVVCPYCGHEAWHTFHYGADTLICDSCDKEFEIELEVDVKVKSTMMLDY